MELYLLTNIEEIVSEWVSEWTPTQYSAIKYHGENKLIFNVDEV